MFDKKFIYQILPVVIAGLLVTEVVVLAWTEPGSLPPGGNVSAPVNIGGTTQYKSGALGVGGVFQAYSTAIFKGPGGFGSEPIRAQSNSTFFSGVDVGGTQRFAINNDPGPTLNFYGWDTNWFNWMTVNNSGTKAVSFNAGNVGIGTANPNYKLDVEGGGAYGYGGFAHWLSII